MGITIDTKRSKFYQELSLEMRKQYLGLTRDKTHPMIDNIYYTVFITNDSKEDVPGGIKLLLQELETSKQEAIAYREPIVFEHGLYYLLKSYSSYGYCVGDPDLYDIFCCKALPNDDTPRLMVQVRAFGLWTRGVDEVLAESFSKVEALLAQYACTVNWCRESRIDYCFHTNAIASIDKLLVESKLTTEDEHNGKHAVKNMHTNLKRTKMEGENESTPYGTVIHKDYLCFGQVESNNVRARIYDKVKEVIERGYKSFFFQIWYDNGLISYYDKWCMEYAFPYKNIDYLYKAAIAFYVAHCDEFNEQEFPYYLGECHRVLNSESTSLAEFKALATEYMPKVTKILNIEYETKRKFYYYSDDFINGFKLTEERGNISKPMARIYKILDYRDLFLDYLTSKTLSFHRGEDENGNLKYLTWWKRLRHAKHDGKTVDGKLLRAYSNAMDKRAVQKRAINAIASSAVYNDRVETSFVEDLSDMLADINDNDAQRMIIYDSESGDVIEDMKYARGVSDYMTVKAKKDKLLKNRKKQRDALAAATEQAAPISENSNP